MNSDKKLSEELLKSDNIDPAKIPDSEHKMFEQLLDKHLNSGQSKQVLWRIIMKSKITKLAAAAAIIIVILLSRSTESSVWASIIKAYEQVQFVHIVEWEINSDSEKIKRSEYWVKRPNKFRGETPGYLTIDNGVEELVINKDAKTAQLSDSQQGEFPQAQYVFAFVNWFRDQNPDFAKEKPILTKIPEECTEKELVYDGQYKRQSNVHREVMKFKIWVDANTMLINRIAAYTGQKNPNLQSNLENDFDYQTISDEIFEFNIPDGYKVLPPPEQTVFSGVVLDENDKPLRGVEVHILGGASGMSAITDIDGKFATKKQTELGAKFGFPLLIRAYRKNAPDEVAWTILQDPENKQELSFEKNVSDEDSWSTLQDTEDKQELTLDVPDCGDVTLLIDPNAPSVWKCVGATGIVLKMQPALQISGKVTDKNNNGLKGAEINLQNLWLSDNTGISNNSMRINASCITDSQGNYALGSLPNLPKGFSIKLRASIDGYITSNETQVILDGTLKQAGPDFALLDGGVTIKGIVKNIDGEPLPYYGIWHTVNGEKVGPVQSMHEGGGQGSYAFTGKKGEFELVNCPAMNGLEVTASGAGKSPSWDFWIRNWKLDRTFEFYDEKTIKIGYEKGKNEYTVEIVLEKAATTVEFEVKNPEGQPIANAEVSFGTSPYNYSDDFKTTTDETGKCVLNNLPWVKQPRLSVRKFEEPQYVPIVWKTIEFSENIKHYKIEIKLNYGNSRQQIPLEKQIVVKPQSD